MRRPPPLPDLTKLTDAQKDELIVNLWQTLIATDAAAAHPAPNTESSAAPTTLDDLRDRLRRTAPSHRAQSPIECRARLGRGLGILESKLLLGVLLAIGIGFIADYAIGWYQQRALAIHDRAALELQNAAFGALTIELTRITYEPDGKSYRATLDMQNSNPDVPLYIMLTPVRVFAQVGLTWQEVPAQAPSGTSWGVLRLNSTHTYQVIFQTDTKDWAELLPGYMHMRIQSDTLISRSSEPKDDIFERNNRFYVYLKPQDADDDVIRRRSNFPGTPPIFIPMPPH